MDFNKSIVVIKGMVVLQCFTITIEGLMYYGMNRRMYALEYASPNKSLNQYTYYRK